MTHYINKSALVAEIERRITNIKGYCLHEGHDIRFDVVPEQLSLILAFLDTLEVKEVELDWEINLWVKNLHRVPNFEELNKFAKHFFELGLKAQKGE